MSHGRRSASHTTSGQTQVDVPSPVGRVGVRARAIPAFTLIELLVVIAIIAILASLMFPVLMRGKLSAQRVGCGSNLREMGASAHMYWDDNEGNCFKWYYSTTNEGSIYWFGWIKSWPWPEGERPYDPRQGVLFPYLDLSEVRLCPSLDYHMPEFKYKASGAVCSYGYNLYLSTGVKKPPLKALKIPRPADTLLFADSAQINDFQEPASSESPMLEEWYYVDANTSYPNGHFRHKKLGNVVFADGHVDFERPVPGSLDTRIPRLNVARYRSEILLLK